MKTLTDTEIKDLRAKTDDTLLTVNVAVLRGTVAIRPASEDDFFAYEASLLSAGLEKDDPGKNLEKAQRSLVLKCLAYPTAQELQERVTKRRKSGVWGSLAALVRKHSGGGQLEHTIVDDDDAEYEIAVVQHPVLGEIKLAPAEEGNYTRFVNKGTIGVKDRKARKGAIKAQRELVKCCLVSPGAAEFSEAVQLYRQGAVWDSLATIVSTLTGDDSLGDLEGN